MALEARLRQALRAVEPHGARVLREAAAFAGAHGLTGDPRERLSAYRQARTVGLHLLPQQQRLDGLVVDVGANHGAFTDAVRRLEPRSRVLAVEPEPGNVARLEERFRGDDAVTVVACAASDQAGTATLNVTAGTEFASLHAPRSSLADSYGDATRLVDRREIATAPLDDLVDGPVEVLKVDVQGHELALLRGAGATLERTAVVLIEVLFVSHYEGDATFGAVDEALRAHGFTLAGLEPWGPPGGEILWADACYVPAQTVSGHR